MYCTYFQFVMTNKKTVCSKLSESNKIVLLQKGSYQNNDSKPDVSSQDVSTLCVLPASDVHSYHAGNINGKKVNIQRWDIK